VGGDEEVRNNFVDEWLPLIIVTFLGMVLGAIAAIGIWVPQTPAEAKALYEQLLAEEQVRHAKALGEEK